MTKKPKLRGRPAPQTRQAVGVAEAAAIMGVHWATPSRMVEKGMLTAHVCQSRSDATLGERAICIFDGAECEENYLDYAQKIAERGGMNDARPRANLDSRDTVLKHLATVEPIAFADACGSGEAAEILGVHPSFLTRMVTKGEIVGRSPWNPRGVSGTTRNWIFSRASCHRNAATARKLEVSGKKKGRPRKSLDV